MLADHLLAPHFRDTYPLYPSFKRLSQPVTESTRETAARDAVIFLARSTRTNLALGVVAGLGLLDENEALRPPKFCLCTPLSGAPGGKARGASGQSWRSAGAGGGRHHTRIQRSRTSSWSRSGWRWCSSHWSTKA